MNSEDKVLIVLNDGLPRTVEQITEELRSRGEADARRIAKEGAWGLAERGQATFNPHWELEVPEPSVDDASPKPFTVEECQEQARRLLELAIKEDRDRGLKHCYARLKLAFQGLAMQLDITQETDIDRG